MLAGTFALQGCIALAAVPIIASGGLIGRSVLTGERTRQAIAEGTAIDPAEVDVAAYAQFTVLPTSELPAPAAAMPSQGRYAALHRFVDTALAAAPDQRFSVLLDNPSTLQPTRVDCEEDVPAVLVDLDPVGGLMPLTGGANPDPALVAVLDDLRRRDVAIAWMTDHEPTEAGAIRQRLLATGLDPSGRDPLFVQRYPGETRQERRRALLETHCLLAIAGDERADFDDLYQYLRDADAASPLEAMVDAGWFIIPSPFD